jgi:hypothetical protein
MHSAQDLPDYRKRWLATLIVVLTACTPSTEKVPLTGTITLKYAGTTRSYDGAVFALANGTGRSIFFRGIPEPRQWDIRCYRSNESEVFSSSLIDPPPKETDIELASGEGLRFNLYFVASDLKNTKGTCRLNLTLKDKTNIESAEFAP